MSELTCFIVNNTLETSTTFDEHVYSLGYMSQDSVNLAVLEATGDEKEKARAGKVLGLLKKGQHWVLGASLNTI